MDSSTPASSESVDSESDTTRKEFGEKLNSNICPFKLQWSFGMNCDVPLINLTTENRTIIAYACSHVVMIYNYESKEALPFQGHQNTVRDISVSADGKWLLTADFEDDSVVVVWDTESGVPINTLFNPHGEAGMTAARISPDAKYIVTVGNEEHQKVHFWLWTYGRDKPDATIELNETPSERVKEIAFNEEFSEKFVLTTDHRVLFFLWKPDDFRYCSPRITKKSRGIGILNSTCFVPRTLRAFTATSFGFVLVWRKMDNEEEKHLKSVKLQRSSINVILHYERMIVTGNSEGRINFYDQQLRILYWCENSNLDSIRSISFDLRSSLLDPLPVVSDSDLEFFDREDAEGEGEFEEDEETVPETNQCEFKKNYFGQLEFKGDSGKISSKLTVSLEYSVKDHGRQRKEDPLIKSFDPVDATLHQAPFTVGNFFVCTATGVVAMLDISKSECHFFTQGLQAPVTSLDVHPESKHVVTGNVEGLLCLYKYEQRSLVVSRRAPSLPNFRPILDNQATTNNIIYVTCPQSHESLTAVTVLKYSPRCDILVCGTENGALWMLHPITLEPVDEIPYKHSTEAILKLIFTKCAEYMAYTDNALVVAVFKRNSEWPKQTNHWNFIGKYHSHYRTIRDILFGPPSSGKMTPRLFSLGEDQDIVEYDLENSGPFPEPGLKILQIDRIEYTATPLCLAWYPTMGVESFLVISNSEYKYRLVNDTTKQIRGTFLGPTFGAPVQQFQILSSKESTNNGYMVFVTEKEIGLQLLPLDGNPYRSIGMVGHPRKITCICIDYDGCTLFSAGYNDPCVLMWKIKLRSVDVMARLGGKGLLPFYCLIQGGRRGWLINEMRDLFYYAQILQQGENTTATRIVSDKVATKQIPNLMRAIGYYPSYEELELIMGEVSYRNYAETGELVEEITFEEFVKLYVNHRPAFGFSMRQMKKAFQAFAGSRPEQSMDEENPVLTREQFLDILFGKGPHDCPREDDSLFGEPFTPQEAYMYLKLLVPSDDNLDEVFQDKNPKSFTPDFSFLPERISYKDFTTNIMGIELSEETRADNE